MDDKKKKVKKVDSPDEEEKMRILAQADEVKGEQLSILPDGGIFISNELKLLLEGKFLVDDPEKKYDLYYKGIEKLLRKHLRKGKEYAKSRGYIREEKNVFMTRGKRINEQGIRGADSRMTYIDDAQEMLKIISNWILRSGTMVELYNEFRELNINKGYGTRVIY